MSYADVNGLHLYYEEHGDGTPLILLHGGMLTVDAFLATLSSSDADLRGWRDEQLAAITTPVRLIPGSRLAVLPGTTHMLVTRRADLLLPILAAFLGEFDDAGVGA